MIKKLGGRIVYENQWIRLREDGVEFPDGHRGTYTYHERVDEGPMMIAQREDGKLLVLREWRYPIQNWVYQFPAGGKMAGEDTLAAAKRELEEETGCKASNWKKLGVFYMDPGGSSQKTDVFLATDISVGQLKKESAEVHDAMWMGVEELEQLSRNEIVSGWLLSGLQLLKNI